MQDQVTAGWHGLALGGWGDRAVDGLGTGAGLNCKPVAAGPTRGARNNSEEKITATASRKVRW